MTRGRLDGGVGKGRPAGGKRGGMVTTLDWDGRGREWRVRYGEAEGPDGGRCPQVAGLHQGLPSITRQRKEAIGQAFLQKEPGGMGERVRRAPFTTLHGARERSCICYRAKKLSRAESEVEAVWRETEDLSPAMSRRTVGTLYFESKTTINKKGWRPADRSGTFKWTSYLLCCLFKGT